MREETKEIETGFEPTRWVVPEQQEIPTSVTLNPRVMAEDVNLAWAGMLPESQVFHVDEIEIVQ